MHDLSWERLSLYSREWSTGMSFFRPSQTSDFIRTFCSVGMSVYVWHLILVLYLCHTLLAYGQLFALALVLYRYCRMFFQDCIHFNQWNDAIASRQVGIKEMGFSKAWWASPQTHTVRLSSVEHCAQWKNHLMLLICMRDDFCSFLPSLGISGVTCMFRCQAVAS